MSNELTVVGSGALAIAEPKGSNYIVTSPLTGATEKLKRDVDFGVIPGTKRPSLFKSGAEKIIGAYQLMPRYSVESRIEQYDAKTSFFMYVIKCELIKGFVDAEGKYTECVYSTGFGSANTGEKRNGFNDACNSANSTLKMAQKRAMVSAAISLSGLSDMFTMDIEDEAISKKAKDLVDTDNPEAPITKAQITRIYAIAGDCGITTEECKTKIRALGFASTKDIKQKDYNTVCEAIKNIGENNGTKNS